MTAIEKADAPKRPFFVSPHADELCEHGTPVTMSCEFCSAEQERADELADEDFDPEGPGL